MTENEKIEASIRAHYNNPANGFVTKDSGQRAAFSNGGVRDTQKGKPRFDLLLPKNVPYLDQLLTRAALLMGRGADKYKDRNWEQFSDEEALDRAKSSAHRHLMQLVNGEDDEDHAAAVVFNVMVIEYVKGVLAGKWAPLNGGPELWTGSYQSPEPPAHVVQLRRTNRPRKVVGEEEFLWRLNDGSWLWARKGEYTAEEWDQFLRTSSGFFWAPTSITTYEFEEVPQS